MFSWAICFRVIFDIYDFFSYFLWTSRIPLLLHLACYFCCHSFFLLFSYSLFSFLSFYLYQPYIFFLPILPLHPFARIYTIYFPILTTHVPCLLSFSSFHTLFLPFLCQWIIFSSYLTSLNFLIGSFFFFLDTLHFILFIKFLQFFLPHSFP